jgi:diguanylate cyclase (GGDEF)-like protein
LGPYVALLWLTALVPAFLLAYYRGWRGVATALAAGMATLSLTHATLLTLGGEIPALLPGVAVGYLGISLGIGWLAETMHHDRNEVEDMAFTDILTRLPNRRHARLFLENEFAAAERGRLLSIVIFDLDHFKRYNDRFGHPAGDDALKAFADILAGSTRRMDLSGRFGGEEFISILAASDTEGALIFADRIRVVLLNTPLPTGAKLTVSAGVATYHPSMRSPDELLAAADSALYESKHQGRNRVRLFGHALLDSAMPSPDADEDFLASLNDTNEAPANYPRDPEEMGRTRPPLTLLPHQLTGFGKGRNVLVVEDDEQVQRLVSNYLAREEFDVKVAADTSTGIGALGEEFDVVVTDLKLPGAGGNELIRAVKARWPRTQVLVITGLQDPAVAAGALTAGADRYLFKPFGMPELRRHLVDSLGRRDRAAWSETMGLPGDADTGTDGEVRLEVEAGVEHLARALLTRHPFLRGHAERVNALAARLAEELGCDVAPAQLSMACRLCDLGMLSLPPSLLLKSDRLSSEEIERIRSHPTVGRQMLEHLVSDDEVLGVVTWHHERWDGGRYPDGLAGAAIPQIVRIVSLSDVLAAMTAPRPYRKPIPWGEAIAEITAQSGLQFDPYAVEALRDCLPDLRAIFESFGGEEEVVR